jgi:hypothetical protein
MNWIYPELYKAPDYTKKVKFVDTISTKNNISKTIIADKDSILSLVKAFTRIYPLMSLEIEKILPKQFRFSFGDILKEEPSAIEQHKKAMQEQADCIIQKSTTNSDKKQISKIYKYNYYYELYCYKCKYKKIIKLKDKNDIGKQKVNDIVEEHIKQSPRCKISNIKVWYRKKSNKI